MKTEKKLKSKLDGKEREKERSARAESGGKSATDEREK